MSYQINDSIFFRFVTKYACDRQTDGQKYDPQDRTSIAASRGEMLIKYNEKYDEKKFNFGRLHSQKISSHLGMDIL